MSSRLTLLAIGVCTNTFVVAPPWVQVRTLLKLPLRVWIVVPLAEAVADLGINFSDTFANSVTNI
jgi:hypothetical protein